MVEGSDVRPEQDRWELGIFANYARNQLVVVDADGALTSHYVSGRLGFDVAGSVTIVGPFALGLDIPFFLAQTGDFDPSFAGLGDIRVVPKVRLLDDRDSVGLGLSGELRLPTHAGDYAGGARMVVFAPKLLFDHRFGGSGFRLGANAGVTVRQGTGFFNVEAASELAYGVAMDLRFGGWRGPVALGLEIDGAVGLTDVHAEELPLEASLFVRGYPSEEWELVGGPRLGLVPGYGEPVAGVFFGVRFTPTSHDADGDGIADEDDKCPNAAEDRDGDEDADGCPEEDPDHDRDGVADDADDCPNEKETINGVEDDDGCPDGGAADVVYESGRIRILKNIEFRTGSASIDPASYGVLDQVALTIKANPDTRVEVGGHTDDTGPRDYNMRLSQQRADAVRGYLIARGISAERVTAKGYGPDKPLVEGTSTEARSKNRRVEFVVDED
ncbi:MAG: OmpA family protein [Polyangiaceae bacterium]|nr:OmpA family protein [Polyangiaceae bacterium]